MPLGTVDVWLSPLENVNPCGQNLEYDNDFLALEEAGRPQPDQEFVDPDSGERRLIVGGVADWPGIRRRAESLLGRTRDLRVAIWLMRALLHTEGFGGLAVGLGLISGLLERFWEGVYPQLDADDGDDPTMRLNALAPLVSFDEVLGDLRRAVLASSRHVGQVTVRDVEIALGRLAPGDGEQSYSEDQICRMLRDADDIDVPLRSKVDSAEVSLGSLELLLQEHLGVGAAIDFKPLRDVLRIVRAVMPGSDEVAAGMDAGDSTAAETVQKTGAVPVAGEIASRQDVTAALERIIEYLERAEPTNPAQLLIRRAQRVMGMSFLEAMNELAPEGLAQAERSVGSQFQQE